ncbi:arylsulfatase [uncultured Algoriphagus sp.]|uniref:arylsulfatase n=1 Tax=uncultured Algoriphagus sp. TaxID=417365 RepID=UPI0030EE3816|tara:strand:- start:12166 stop:13686 length:1521 start_codon:yes stop_codon:yes gene_type:complete
MINPINLFLLLLFLPYQLRLAEEKPNIVLILADDLGWSDIGSYGSEVETPNLDWLAERGVRFTQMYNTSKCNPSRAALITGMYAQQVGYGATYLQPLKNGITVGELLKSAGYITLWAGKHHGFDHPMDRGFDRYYGLKEGASNHFNPGPRRDNEPEPAQKRPDRPFYEDRKLMQPYTVPQDYYSTDYFTKYALQWLDEYKEDKKPFFLYLSYTAPHDPLMAWPEDIKKYKGKYSEGYEAIRKKRFEKQKKLGIIDESYSLSEPTYAPWESLSDSVRKVEELKMEVYAAMIDRMDQKIGEIIQKLRKQGKLDNTVFLFLSDNGASAEVVTIPGNGEIGSVGQWTSLGPDWANVGNTPHRFYKNYSFEGGIKTPLIISWPKGLGHENEVSAFPAHLIDILPTLAEIAGANYPTEYKGNPIFPAEGQSLLPAIRGEKSQREEAIFWEWSVGKAVRKGDWKLVTHGENAPWELYNLKSDPTEINNLIILQPEIAKELEIEFQNWKTRVSL